MLEFIDFDSKDVDNNSDDDDTSDSKLKILLKDFFKYWIMQITVTIVQIITTIVSTNPCMTKLVRLLSLKNIIVFDCKISDFANSDLNEKETNRNYDEKFAQISKDDLLRNAKITALDNQKRENLDGVYCLKWKERRKKKFFTI